MSQTVQRITTKGDGILDAITDTKQAAVFATLGLPFKSPGVFVTYDRENTPASGGIAHFCFASNEQNCVGRLQEIWEEAQADVRLDALIDKMSPEISRAFMDRVVC